MLLHDPQVLLLDEPASGLDPRARIKIRQLIKKLGAMGKTVMVSSHILPELADICNRIGIIEKGEMIVNASVADVMRRLRHRTTLHIDVAGDRFGPGQLLVFRPGDRITIRAVEDARFMLLGGEPMDGPRYIWWNFVSSRKERIEQAKADWSQGRFDSVPGETEFIPLPEPGPKVAFSP